MPDAASRTFRARLRCRDWVAEYAGRAASVEAAADGVRGGCRNAYPRRLGT